ncbi:MAG: class II aldolase/adducin family protein [Rhodospirillales bacterium]
MNAAVTAAHAALDPSAVDPAEEARARVDLAAAFRWAARCNMHESVANHFSAAVSPDGSKFLVNRCGQHFSTVKAGDLIVADAENPDAYKDDVDRTALCIHGAMHRNAPQARCVMHLHPEYATALASLEDSSMPPIDQNTARFHNRIAHDSGFDGMGLGGEAERMSKKLGNKSVMLMGNHGVMTCAATPALAWDLMYYFERAAKNLILALSTGRKLKVLSDETAEKTAAQWEEYDAQAHTHLDALKEILDREEPEYRK